MHNHYNDHALTSEPQPRIPWNLQSWKTLASLVIITVLNLSNLWRSVFKKRRNIVFSLYAHAKHKNPCLGVHEIYNFVRSFLGHHYSILDLSDPCPSVYKKMKRKNAFSLIDLCGYTLTWNSTQRVMKFTTLVDPSLVIITMHLVCLNHVPD